MTDALGIVLFLGFIALLIGVDMFWEPCLCQYKSWITTCPRHGEPYPRRQRMCEWCGKHPATREVCVFIMTDIEWPEVCDECVDKELADIRKRYADDPQLMSEVTEELLLGPQSVRDIHGNIMPTYGVRYPR